MSGFEIVGVVLGAAPLIISALEAYQKLGKKRDAFRNKSLHIDRMVRALIWQQKLIFGDIKLVLRNAGLDETTIDQCEAAGSYQGLFKRHDVQDAMGVFLGGNRQTYVDIVHQYEITLLRVAKSLNTFDGDGKVGTGSLAAVVGASQTVNKNDSAFWRRVKFSMHRDELEVSINEIDGFSRLLERLRNNSEQDQQIPVHSASTTAKVLALVLQKVQAKASDLYKALADAWTLTCQDSHEARLYLDHRIDALVSNKRDLARSKQEKVKFGVALQGCPDSLFRVCMVEALNVEDSLDYSVIGGSNNTTVTFKTSIPGKPSSNKRLEVDNICQVLQQTSKTQSCKLYLIEKEKFCYEHVVHNIIIDRRISHEHGGKMVCLKDLLQDPNRKRILKMKPRVRLAATMASSTLQLHATPWCSGLRCESIWFVQDPSGAIDLESPFIAHKFTGTTPNNTSRSYPHTIPQDQAESDLLDLGVTILELWHNELIETFADDFGLTYDGTFDSRKSVARKWLLETQEDMLPSTYDAAIRCVNCRFDAVNIDLTDRKLNVSVFEGVIRPLAENCRA